jgi:hypothetical protein
MPLSSVLNNASYHTVGLYGYQHTTEEYYLAYILINSCEMFPTAELDHHLLRFEVLMTVKIHIVVYSILKMYAVCASKILVPTCKTTWWHNQEVHNIDQHY